MLRISQLFILLCFCSHVAAQSLDFTVKSQNPKSPYEGCIGHEFEFKVVETDSTTTVDSLSIFINNQRVVKNTDWQKTGKTYRFKVHLERGKHLPVLRYNAGGGLTPISLAHSDTIKVYDNPKADFEITNDTVQCYLGNEFEIKGLSKKGADGAELVGFYYSDSIGKGKNSHDITLKFYESGQFDIPLIVVDENGCTDKIVKRQYPEVLRKISVNFRTKSPPTCSNSVFKVDNKTGLDTEFVKSWKYRWGDGEITEYLRKDLSASWSSAEHKYLKDGFFSPTLIVEDINGCQDSMTLINAAKNISFNINFKVKNAGPYCVGDSVTFEWKGHNNLTRFQWFFGDPKSGLHNIDRTNLSPTHVFNEPGAYPITLAATIAGCPTKDTTICCIHVNGPQAIIDYPSPLFGTNRGKRPMKVSKAWLAKLNDDPKFQPGVTEVSYYVLKETTPYTIPFKTSISDTLAFPDGREKVAPYIDAVIRSSTGSKTVDYVDTFDYVVVGSVRKWKRKQPIPSETMYQDLGNLFPDPVTRRLIPVDVANAEPNGDSMIVDFPNFSVKYRYSRPFGQSEDVIPRYADDLAALGAATYPDYPYASDSLESFWDFDDPHAINCVSTSSSPNPYCRYSREKAPRHIFTKNGCFNVSLEVTDPKTGCSHIANFPITSTKPNAGFNTSKYSKMDWVTQNKLLAQGESLEGLGLRLEGLGCVGNAADPSFMRLYIDGTEPSCGGRLNYWFVGNAESDCKTKVYLKDGSGNVIDSTYKDCNWIDGTTMKLIGEKWSYKQPGWKNPGLIIQSSMTQYDTFFYNNYIYLPKTYDETATFSSTQLDSLSQRSTYSMSLRNGSINQALDSIAKLDFSIYKIGSTSGPEDEVLLQKDSFATNSQGLIDPKETKTFDLGPGQYRLRSLTESARGCIGAGEEYTHVGHLAGLRAKVGCVGDTVQFHDSIFYFHPMGPHYCQFADWFENLGNCIDTNKFFYRGTAIRQAIKAKNPNYQLPPFTERIGWDFENDGIIDLWDQHNPKHIYKTGGTHICAMWTRDSLGSWQKDSLVVTVENVKLSLSRSVGQAQYICPPAFINFEVKSRVYGDSSATLTYKNQDFEVKDGQVSKYTLHLLNKKTIRLAFEAATSSGCVDSIADSSLFSVFGPDVDFETNYDVVGCVPHPLTVKNLSDTGLYRWEVKGAAAHDSVTTRDLNVTLDQKGSYFPVLSVTQRLLDPVTNAPVTCTSTFPSPSERVPDINIIELEKAQLKLEERLKTLEIRYSIVDFNPFNEYEFRLYKDNYLIDSEKVEDTTFVYGYPSAGQFDICLVTKSRQCVDSLCSTTWVDYLSTPELETSNVSIYPNPAKKWVTIDINGGSMFYELHSVVGQRMDHGRLQTGVNTIDVGHLQNGIYVLLVHGPEGSQNHKLTIKH